MSEQAQQEIDVTQAVRIAKEYVAKVFESDKIERIAIEEVAFDHENDHWRITIGFVRPWDKDIEFDPKWGMGGLQLKYQELLQSTKRTYKVAIITTDGRVMRMENRAL